MSDTISMHDQFEHLHHAQHVEVRVHDGTAVEANDDVPLRFKHPMVVLKSVYTNAFQGK